jgi:hypothetical protein
MNATPEQVRDDLIMNAESFTDFVAAIAATLIVGAAMGSADDAESMVVLDSLLKILKRFYTAMDRVAASGRDLTDDEYSGVVATARFIGLMVVKEHKLIAARKEFDALTTGVTN